MRSAPLSLSAISQRPVPLFTITLICSPSLSRGILAKISVCVITKRKTAVNIMFLFWFLSIQVSLKYYLRGHHVDKRFSFLMTYLGHFKNPVRLVCAETLIPE